MPPYLDTGDPNNQQFANVFGGTVPTQKNQQITQEDWDYSMANRPSPTMDSSTFLNGGGGNAKTLPYNPGAGGFPTLPGVGAGAGGLPTLPGQAGDINSYMNQVKGFFTPLDDQTKANIRQSVEATFAPRFADQQRTNDYRTALFAGGRAQSGDLGFGASDLARGGIGQVGDYNNQKINELRNLLEGEVNDRVMKAQDRQYQQTQDYLTLADKFRTNEQSALQQQFANQLSLQDQSNQNATTKLALQNSVIEQMSNLDASTFGNLPLTDIETAYGLQPGFLQALKATKDKALTVKNTKDLSEVFNSGVELATKLPVGQSFSLKSPIDGDTITFTGSSPDELQIVSNSNGIFKFNKNTGELTRVAPGTGGGSGDGNTTYVPGQPGTNQTFDQWLAAKQQKEMKSYNVGNAAVKQQLQNQYNQEVGPAQVPNYNVKTLKSSLGAEDRQRMIQSGQNPDDPASIVNYLKTKTFKSNGISGFVDANLGSDVSIQ